LVFLERICGKLFISLASRQAQTVEYAGVMKYYVVQVKSNSEEKYIELFEAVNYSKKIKLYFPRREINERKEGRTTKKILPVFPGYVFVEFGENENISDFQRIFTEISGFCRFLRSNSDVTEVKGKDLDVMIHFAKKTGPIAGVSKVYFNEQNRIVVKEGPLMGFEGLIIKTDKRKGRAKIKLDFYNKPFTIDLAFEVISFAKIN
jgi:transcriptional antiterminator NusG